MAKYVLMVAEIRGAALVEIPPPVGELAAAQVTHHPDLAVALSSVDQTREQEVLAGDGGVGLHLADPVPVRLLLGQEVTLRALDRRIDRGHNYRC